MKKVRRILQKKITPRKSNGNQSFSFSENVDIPKNEICKRKVLERYKNAWYAELNNQYESSDSSGSEIDDETGYIRMKRNSRLKYLHQNDGSFEYSCDGDEVVNDGCTNKFSDGYYPYFMRASFDFLSYDIDDLDKEVTIHDGEIVKVHDVSHDKKYLVENINGCKVNIPKYYLVELAKEELLEILNQMLDKESAETTLFEKADEKTKKETNLNINKVKSSKKERRADHKFVKSSSKEDCQQKTSISRKNSDFKNKTFNNAMTKYTSLTENLDKDEALEREDEEKMFQYKINPALQRKTMPKKPLIFDQEIWVDGETSTALMTSDELETEKNTTSVTFDNNQNNNQEDRHLQKSVVEDTEVTTGVEKAELVSEDAEENEFIKTELAAEDEKSQIASEEVKETESAIEDDDTEIASEEYLNDYTNSSVEKLTNDDRLIVEISSSISIPKNTTVSTYSDEGKNTEDHSLSRPANGSNTTVCTKESANSLLLEEEFYSSCNVLCTSSLNELDQDRFAFRTSSPNMSKNYDKGRMSVSSENEELMIELSNQQELLLQQIEELNSIVFDE